MSDSHSLARRRHLVVGAIAFGVFLTITLLLGLTPERWVDIDEPKADSWLWRLSTAAADTAILLLVATLLWGPIYVFRGGRPRIHSPWRRVMGVWAGGFAVGHVALAMFVHATWQRIWTNWFEISPPKLAGGARGLANWIGAVQFGVVVMLLWLSRDTTIRRLGADKWKWLQRSSYLLVIMVSAHAFLYHRVEQRITAHRAPVVVILALVVVVQAAGALVVMRRRRLDSSAAGAD